MGIEWLYRGKSGMKKRSTNEEGEEVGAQGCMGAVFHLFKFHYYPFALHPHPHQYPPSSSTTTNVAFFHHHEPTHVLKGVEAPRNSLEEKPLKEVASSSTTSFSKLITDGYLHKQMMSMKIKTTRSPNLSSYLNSKPKNDRESSPSLSENSVSPSIKTPNLVARLMGLETLDLPSQSTSPKLDEMIFKNPSYKNRILTTTFDKNFVSGTVSLPETPRISASGKTDVENRRFSLQLEDIPAYTIKTEKSDRSKKQILKQVKEKVGRTFGLDVTNTMKCGNDSNLAHHISNIMNHESSGFSRRVLNPPSRKEPQIKLSLANSLSNQDKKENEKHFESAIKVKVHLNQNPKKSVGSGSRLRKPPQACDDGVRSKKEEPIATNKGIIVFEKKVKKTPLSSDLVNIRFHANPQLHNQGPNHSSFIIKQTKQNLPSYNSFSSSTNLYNNHKKVDPTCHKFQEYRQPLLNCTSNFIHNSEQLNHYIQWILRRTGVEKEDGHVSLNKLYSINHPLDPSLFHYLELFHSPASTGTLKHGGGGKVRGAMCTTRVKTRGTYCSACDFTRYGDTTQTNPVTVCAMCFAPNRKMYGRDCTTCVVCTCGIDSWRQRKLVFDLVDEHLADILVNPFMNLGKLWIVNGDEEKIRGADLVEMLCERIEGSLRSVKCEVREDIDALIYDDLRRVKVGNKWHGFEEEQEHMIMYIEDCIVRELVHETTMMLNNVMII